MISDDMWTRQRPQNDREPMSLGVDHGPEPIAHGIVGGTLVDPDCCVTCGDEYGRAKLMAGECDGCRNIAAGLCWCGRAVYAGHRQCDQCSADERADYLFHADR